ncbi:MAG TPA: hypothetical protein VIX14_03365 [Terriglobales bacterium]
MRSDAIDRAFCSSLIALLRLQKQIVPVFLDNVTEYRILKEAVKGLDPTFADVMKQKREETQNQITTDPRYAAMQDLLPAIDEMIETLQQLMHGEIS